MKKRFLAIFIVVMMLFSQITVFASVPDLSTTSINPEDKLTDELKQVMSNTPNGEYIPIYIWLNDDYSDELVYAHLSNKLGEEINGLNESAYISKRIEEKVEQYKTKQFSTQQRSATLSMQSAFENLSLESKISSLRNNAELSSIVTNEEIENCLNDGKSFEDIIELSERYQYLSDYRDSRLIINETMNEQFEDKLDNGKVQNLIVDTLLPYIEVDCQNEYILTISSLSEVKEVGYLSYTSEMIDDLEQEETRNNTEKNIVAPTNTGYTGNGIKVGVLEAADYNRNASHLVGKNIVSYSSSGNATDNSHATKVMSILAGKKLTLGTTEYQGIAPDASLFFGYSDLEHRIQVLHWMIVEKDVVVINISLKFGWEYNYSYEIYDRYLDCLVQQYRVVIVKSAGNESGNISCPGLAYNIITVGNISNDVDENGLYLLRYSSNYDEADYLTNKPDISAFGTDVHMVYGGVESNFTSGTSYSAPMVTGTVALMMEANNELIGKPDAIKALLVNSADSEIVSLGNVAKDDNGNDIYDEENNPVYENGVVSKYDLSASYSSWNNRISSQIKEKSGAGLLNVKGSVSMADSNLLHRFAISRNSIANSANRTIGEFYIERNTIIEFTLVFEKPYDNKITSLSSVNFDFEIELYKGTEKVMSSVSNVNNVESFRVNIPETGNYSFKIKCDKLNGATDEVWNFEDGYGDIEQHISHEDFYVTMVVSCGCELPSANVQNCVKESHDIVCDNCGFLFEELHNHITTTQYYNDVTIQYEVYYKVRQFNGDINDVICYYDAYPILATTDSSNGAVYIQDMSYTEYRADKRWDMLNFEIIVFDSENNVIANFVSTIYVNLYYDTGECDFEVTI